MSVAADLRMYARFAGGLRRFLRRTMTAGEAEAIIAARFANRAENFLRLLERGVYGHPASPYLALLRHAQAEFEDVRALVRSRGLEPALSALKDAGVYVEFDAFKGRRPLVRNGQVIHVKPHDFDNPFLQRHYAVQTGGSTGAGTRVNHDLDHLADRAPQYVAFMTALDLLKMPIVFWRPVLPAGSGINGVLVLARVGNPPVRWFTPVSHEDLRASRKYRVATQAIIAASRLFGSRLPFPETVPLREAGRIARVVADLRNAHGVCLLRSSMSLALRVCLAAQEDGIDFSGVTVIGGGEPVSASKVTGITASGARFLPAYFFAESGPVGWACGNPSSYDDMHLLDDALALVQKPRILAGTDEPVGAFLFTSLLPAAPKILLNVEIDDFGLVTARSCGCGLEAYGYRRHLANVQSFSKLNNEGVTLPGSQMVHALTHVLPARFGGSPLDYQLVQDEDEQGMTRLTLRISPRISLVNEQEPVRALFEVLGASDPAADLARGIWTQAGTLRVQRREPYVTAAGKQPSLHVVRGARE